VPNFFCIAFFLALSIFVNASASGVSDQDKILWLNFDIAPGGISSGPFKAQGIGYQFYKTYKEVLPEYQHSFIYANVARMRKIIESPQNSCIVYIFHLPEYTKYRHWGPINYIAPPNRIVTTPKMAKYFSSKKPSLAALLDDSSLRLGVMTGRAYRVPEILKANKDNPNIITAYSSSRNVYRMLDAGRLDYTLGDWVEVDFLEKTLGVETSFITFPMKEDTGYKENYVSCTGNKWGKTIVDKLHRHFSSLAKYESEVLPSIIKWIRPVDQVEYKQNYMKQVNNYLISK